ncbi:MAG: glycosyltransferase family 4 protein [Chitinophagaceae bacterium]|nr:glycosyltransferase family 4 protein [Chitinophagaceae bacterium]
MGPKKKKILFVSHAASHSGAPIVLLGIIKEFVKQSNTPFHILILRDGPLVKEFKALGETHIWNKSSDASSTLSGRAYSKLSRTLRQRHILSTVSDSTMLFFNTIANGVLYNKLSFIKGKRLCYVHELEVAIRTVTTPGTLSTILASTDFYFAVSEAVRQNLINNHGIAPEKITISRASVSEVCRQKGDHTAFIKSFRSTHNISPDAVLIGVAGTNEWRKGVDLFFPLILIYLDLYPDSDVHFIWKGFRDDHASAFAHKNDATKYRVGNRAILLPHGNDSLQNIACFDIHLLLAREDPYPLVVLEAASFGIPTVSFLDAGGSPEFIGTDSGICVTYGDLKKMAIAIHELVINKDLRIQMGKTAQEKVKRMHDQKNITREIISTIGELYD